jgi:two-component system cell cycle sensor histidine kinase/response regulator CckA
LLWQLEDAGFWADAMNLVSTTDWTLGKRVTYFGVTGVSFVLVLVSLFPALDMRAMFSVVLGAVVAVLAFFLFDYLLGKHARSMVCDHFETAPELYFLADKNLSIKFANRAARDWGALRTLRDRSFATILSTKIAGADQVLKNLQFDRSAPSQIQHEFETLSARWRMDVTRWSSHMVLVSLRQLSVRDRNIDPSVPWLRIEEGRIVSLNQEAGELLGSHPTHLSDIFPKTVSWGVPVLIGNTGVDRHFIPMRGPQSGNAFEVYLFPFENVQLSMDWSNRTEFDDFPVALLKLGQGGEVQRANQAARDLFERDFEGKENIASILEGLGRSIPDWLEDTFEDRCNGHPEFLRLRRRDKEVFVQVALSKVKQSGEPALFAVVSDATELKTLEAQFVQSQKMQAIGQLAGGVAHDFNNLLTAITGHCDLLLLRHDQSDGDYADLMQINQNANRAAALVGQLLAFSRKQTLRPEVLDLRATLADLTHLLNRLVGEKVQLGLFHHPDLASIRADKRQLEQVIMNLVVNARDAMPDGGEIRVEMENVAYEEATKREHAELAPGRYVVIRIADQGCGIDPDNLAKIFEPFFTTKRTGEGTGLGLSTVYGIVKQTGGFVFVDSALNEGTVFTLMFPACEAEQAPQIEPKACFPKRHLASEDGVILLVEDEAPVRRFASRALQLRGYHVIEATCAEEALDLLEDDALLIDVIITDVIMPGKDGPTWVQIARKNRPDVRVIFVSGYAEDSFPSEQAQITGSVFLPKPFSLDQLTQTVQAQFD